MQTGRFGFLSAIAVTLVIIFGIAPAASPTTCTPSSLSLSPVSLNAITGTVDTIDTTTTINDNCGNSLEYTATVTGGSSWLSLPSSGKDTLKVTANNIKGLTPGVYTGKATIKSTGLTDSSLTVTLTIGSTCAATLDDTLKLKAPIIKYTDSASVKSYFWVDEVYTSDPSKVLFKLSDYGSQSTTGYNCNMSWLDSDLVIYARDVLFGGNFYWLKLAYDTSLSDSSNYYFYAKNYGEGSMSGADSSLYFGFSYGTTNTTNSVSSSTGSLPNGKAVSGPISFEVLLTNGAASEAIGALGYLNSDYSFSSITSGIFTKTTSDGQKLFEKIEFGTDGLPASLVDYSTGYTTTFSSYTNGTVHIKVVDSTGAVIVSDKQINIEAEWFTYFSNQLAKSSSAEKTLEAIGYAMGTIFDKITCALAPETTAGNSACGGLIAAATTFGCDLTKTKDGICGYINVVPDGLAGAATLASCVTNLTTQSVSSNTGSSVVDCTKDITAKVIEKAKVNFVKEITPGSGAAGTAVTITGTGFGTTKGTVIFNGITATITSWSETEIKTTVPTGASTGYVVVTDATGVASNGVMFTVINTSLPLNKTFNGTATRVGIAWWQSYYCSFQYEAAVEMALKQVGNTFSGTVTWHDMREFWIYENQYGQTCTVVTQSITPTGVVEGTIDSNNNVVFTKLFRNSVHVTYNDPYGYQQSDDWPSRDFAGFISNVSFQSGILKFTISLTDASTTYTLQ